MHLTRFLAASLSGVALLLSAALARADVAENGNPEALPNDRALVGAYYRSDGLDYNVHLTLSEGGDYVAQWSGLARIQGHASGHWRLDGKRLLLKPSKEDGKMKGHLKRLDVVNYQGGWIFVPSNEKDFYKKYGVSNYSCFQKAAQPAATAPPANTP